MINKFGNIHMTNNRQKSINNRKYDAIHASEALQYRVAQDVKRKNNTINYHFNVDDYNKGIEWFESGLALEDASLEMRNNASFIDGFNKGKRMQLINEELYKLGRKYFDEGKDIPDNYKDNEIFMNGYNDASNGRSK